MKIYDSSVVVAWALITRPSLFRFGSPFSWIRKSKWLYSWTYGVAYPMPDVACITSFLAIPRFPRSLVTTVYSTYFTCLYDRKTFCLRGKAFSYVIGLLPILFKNWSLSFKERDSCLTPNNLNHTLHLLLDSSVSPAIYSALSSSPPTTTNSSFDLLLVLNSPW